MKFIIDLLEKKKVIFLITIISGILLFFPQNLLETIALYQFKEKYKIWLGIVFIFTLGLSVLNIIEYIKEKYDLKILTKKDIEKSKRKEKEYLNMLKVLDTNELSSVREFYKQEKNTIEMISNDPAVAGLIKKEVIAYISNKTWSNVYTGGPVFLFGLTSKAKNYFNKFDFSKLKSIERPDWFMKITNSHKQGNELRKMYDDLSNDFKNL